MKIALLGNINNANFALLRYLKSRGLNVDLLLWKNDGVLSHSHFKPENDTYDFKYWSKFIKRTKISNSISSIIFNPLNIENYITEKYFLKLYQKYDLFIGSGISPALFEKFNKRLDIFYPYAIGVEWVNTFEEKIYNYLNLKNFFYKKLKKLQRKGIKNTRIVVNPELGKTEETLKKINVKSTKIFLPIVYIENKNKNKNKNKTLFKKIEKFNFKIISHARHLWKPKKNLTVKENILNSKNNDWIIKSFAFFLKKSNSNSCLILFKYGDDYKESVKLCKKLNIQKNVIWFPIMPRKKILEIINKSDLGIGEFYVQSNTIWGSSFIEVLSQGKPAFQTLKFQRKKFKKIFKINLPPFISINNSKELNTQFLRLYSNRKLCKTIGKQSKKWFLANYEKKSISNWIQIIKKVWKEKKIS